MLHSIAVLVLGIVVLFIMAVLIGNIIVRAAKIIYSIVVIFGCLFILYLMMKGLIIIFNDLVK